MQKEKLYKSAQEKQLCIAIEMEQNQPNKRGIDIRVAPAQVKREQITDLNTIEGKEAPSKVTLFLSFHIAQKRAKRIALHKLLAFFLTRNWDQLRKRSLTITRHTHLVAKLERRSVHCPHTLEQWIRICFKSSSSLPQRGHLFAMWKPLLFNCLAVSTLPH